MKKTVQIALTIVFGLFLTLNVSAQKFGYLNSAALLAEMPKVKEAEANLETLQKQLQAKGQKMLQDFQGKYTEVERKYSQGEISPKDLEGEKQILQAEEAKIAQFEQEMQKQMLDKREALLQPILDQVNDAIEQVAKEKGYAYIFDASPGVGVLLYADESTNIMSLVKAKLNM